MAINPIGLAAVETPAVGASAFGTPVVTQTSVPGFSEMLARAIDAVNRQEIQAQQLGLALAAGEVTDIHTVTIAAQKAELALDLTLAIRNKVIDAYQEIMRMQV